MHIHTLTTVHNHTRNQKHRRSGKPIEGRIRGKNGNGKKGNGNLGNHLNKMGNGKWGNRHPGEELPH